MAAVGVEQVGWSLLSSGVVSFFIVLLLLSIFLSALCSDCSRRSFELQEPEDKDPSTLVRVVKLEETLARENPMIDQIQSDEKDFNPVSVPTWRSHLGVTQTQDSLNAVMKAAESGVKEDVTAWRRHLGAPQSQGPDVSSSTPLDSAHIYHAIRTGRDSSSTANMTSTPTNHRPGEGKSGHYSAEEEEEVEEEGTSDRSAVYAQVNKKRRTSHEEEDLAETKEVSPPLPDRKTQDRW